MIVSAPEIGQWVLRQSDPHAVYAPQASSVLGYERNGRVIAGFVFENWNGRSMTAHMAIQGRATAEFYRRVADYVFVTCGVHKLIAPVASTNRKAIRLVKKMGFLLEGVIYEAVPDGELLLFSLIEKDCRFLKGKYCEHVTMLQ